MLGTNKQQGLEVYDLQGKRVQHLPVGRLNNVDVRPGFTLGARTVDLAQTVVDGLGRRIEVSTGGVLARVKARGAHAQKAHHPGQIDIQAGAHRHRRRARRCRPHP